MTTRQDETIDLLRNFTAHLDGRFEERFGTSKMILNNEKGNGYIRSYSIYNGLSINIYNITFSEEQQFLNRKIDSDFIYFLYCVEGHFLHKFSNETKEVRLEEMQNVILHSDKNSRNLLRLPANTHLKLTAISLRRDLSEKSQNRANLSHALSQIIASINKNESLRYYGQINPLAGKFAKFLVEHKRTDSVGNLLMEGAIMNTLASQIDNHDKHQNRLKLNVQLSHLELQTISRIGDYILENVDSPFMVKDISNHFGLSEKKIQSGIKFLYGQTLLHFIRDIKLERAKELIHYTDLSISEICYSIGLSSKSYFSKIFSNRFGVVPVKYKKSIIVEDFIFELSYKSNANSNLTSSDINNILISAKKNNLKLNVTGCLIFYENLFFQILEGKKRDILELYKHIQSDSRHYNIVLLTKKVSTKRKFPSWNMGVISDQGDVSIPLNGKPYMLNLKSIINEDNSTDHNSMLFWKRVHNIISNSDLI